MPARVALPAKVLMLATTLMSTLVSLVGGLVMYLEGLLIIDNTVKEISWVELSCAANKLNSSLAETEEAAYAYATLLSTWRGLPSAAEWQEFLQADQFGRVKASVGLYGTGVLVVPMVNTAANSSGFAQIVWWDPLADGTRDWLSASYLPEQWGICADPSRDDTLKHRCLVAHSLDPANGSAVAFAYQWSDNFMREVSSGGFWDKQQVGWEDTGAVWWKIPEVWHSKDDTPYIFGTLVYTLPKQRPDHPIWGEGYKVVITTHNIFNTWEDDLRQTDVHATLVATFLHAGPESQVIATNTGGRLMKNCTKRNTVSGVNPCVITLKQMQPHIQEACEKANRTQLGRFFRTSIGGSEHWVMRLVVLETRADYDDMASIHLVWLRRVSTVEDKLHRALFFFIGFVAAVFIFDVCVLVVEVRHIARPLEQLEWAMQPVDQMDLIESSHRLHGAVADRCFDVAEVQRLVRRFQLTIDSLTTYKLFLPQSCLPRSNATDKGDAASGSEATYPARPASSQWASCPSEGRESSQGTEMKRKGSTRMLVRSLVHPDGFGAQTAEPHHMTVTLLAVNKCGVLRSDALLESTQSAAAAIGEGVTRFSTTVKLHKGNVDLVSGDHHFASFGAAHRCSGHRAAGISCAWGLRSEQGELQSTAAVCCGQVLCGDFGGSAMMRYMTVGGLPCALLVLERMAAQRAIEVLIDSKVHQDAAMMWSCRLIDRVLYPKQHKRPFSVWSIMSRMAVDEAGQEWMYELTNREDPYAAYNAILTQILKGEIRQARAALAELPDSEPPAVEPEAETDIAVTDMSVTLPAGCAMPAVVQALQALWKCLESEDAEEGKEAHLLIQECAQIRVKQEARCPSASVMAASIGFVPLDPTSPSPSLPYPSPK
eukprot:TRINITY_DN1704_c0_g2_i2.p1 TRINITY_DN1704_c0_g2~~TRINITY_DN1704_c0_g2_i2.p1  ORF type:complete len:910 (+),score=230.04 TRINITY_DN1704_c0_g2_i2:86-2731(+)